MTLDIARLGEGGKASAGPRVAVVGCGGAGCNSLKYLNPGLGISSFALGRDPARIKKVEAHHRFVVPETEMDAAVGTDFRISISEHLHTAGVLSDSLKGANMAFVVAGLGGSIGWRCAAMASRVAREHGALSVIIAILPFSVESAERRKEADKQLMFLRKACDGLLTIHNDRITEIAPKLPFSRAMELVSELALLVPHELSAAATLEDVRLLKSAFATARELRADVATAHGADREFSIAKNAVESEWMAVGARDVVSAVLLVSGERDAGEVEECAQELRNSLPNLRYLAFGRSASVPHDGRTLRACAILGLK